jgi:hypothetical protein
MSNSAVWKVLEEMIIELRKRAVEIPREIINDLKSAKVFLEINDPNSDQKEDPVTIERYLDNIEIYVFSEMQNNFESKIVEEWLKRLGEARSKLFHLEKENKFISGIPRNKKWIRVKPIPELSTEIIKKIAEEENLIIGSDKDEKFTIYGKDEDIKKYVKKITELVTKIEKINK